MSDSADRPSIEYPCPWEYKIIGQDQFAMRQAVAGLLDDIEYTITFSHFSRAGKYCSLLVALTVSDEEQRTSIFAALKGHADIMMVL
ncbi:MAG TPA: DUF493 domain-containing protein [Phycisphaerae bacterium]|nr:DUF493 domain-containing protein [Phycisphaerae bacterium]